MISIIQFVVLGLQRIHSCVHSFVTCFLNARCGHTLSGAGAMDEGDQRGSAPMGASAWETQKQTDGTRCLIRAVKEIGERMRGDGQFGQVVRETPRGGILEERGQPGDKRRRGLRPEATVRPGDQGDGCGEWGR